MDNQPWTCPLLSKTLQAETTQLKYAWDKRPSRVLESYLIADVQDPRINVQSILTRHFLIHELFADYDCDYLMDHELRFAVAANWLLDLIKSDVPRHEINDRLNAVLDSLLDGQCGKDATAVPPFLAKTFRQQSFPNYISNLLTWIPRQDERQIPDYLLNTFVDIWSRTLAAEQAPLISVLEPACGSANDYRFFCMYGIEKLLRYTGFELSEKNVVNAKTMFPSADFRLGNIFALSIPDNAYEYCFMHDILEHLSVEGLEQALREICRVTSKKVCLHFFKMDESDRHQIIKSGDYHRNRLSKYQMLDAITPYATHIETIHIDTFLKERYNFPYTHNKQAWTWIIELKR